MQNNTEHNAIRFTHRIYGREKGTSRFRPLNLKDGCFVINLIYASMLTSHEVNRVLEDLRTSNPEMEFEARKMSEMF